MTATLPLPPANRPTASAADPRPQALPGVSTLLRAAGLADQVTDRKVYLQQLKGVCHKLATRPEVPAVVRRAASQQEDLIGSYMAGPMRNKKLPRHPENPLIAGFKELALQSMRGFLFGCEISAHMFYKKEDAQRALVNAGSDACLVSAVTGEVGMHLDDAFRSEDFVNIVRTSHSDRLITLLGQGPKTPEQVEKHLAASTKHALMEGCEHVCFVNVSLDKVPCFGAAVQAHEVPGLTLEYRSLPWNDGDVFDTPERRRPLVEMVQGLAKQICGRAGKTLVLANCHIGMDRSAMTLALTQLAVDHDNAHDAVLPVIANIKAARPHAVSTPPRLIMIAQCAAEARG